MSAAGPAPAVIGGPPPAGAFRPAGSRRGGRHAAKGKGRAGAGGGDDGDDDSGGGGPGSIASTAIGPRPLRDQIARPSFAFCVKCVAEAALRPPAGAVPAHHHHYHHAVFYRGLEVKILPSSSLRFVPWELDLSKHKTGLPEYIGLQRGDECHRIRTRPAPENIYKAQLDITDLHSTAGEFLPEDAYALVLLTNMDPYENENDTFICGQANHGKRVAVISSARYNPTLDNIQNIDRH
ncbi:Peptidase M54 archaemetzincin [Penicillium waksmanii]|uniref:peptidase M54 n=1 Tax=Penicillium waksmanii TaxID=69791 RepID=UPI00254805DC|nr:peptidase M54 [Penicillium waksmanii]KAJ5965754.1 Peptidase M54 archaemetzincin [Penicillium waksmanii]